MEVESQHVDRAEVAYRTPVIAKAQRLLGYQPNISLREGLERTLEWTRSTLRDEVAA